MPRPCRKHHPELDNSLALVDARALRCVRSAFTGDEDEGFGSGSAEEIQRRSARPIARYFRIT